MKNFAVFVNLCILMTQINLHSCKTVEYALDNANLKIKVVNVNPDINTEQPEKLIATSKFIQMNFPEGNIKPLEIVFESNDNAKGYNGDDQIPPPTSNPTDIQGDNEVVTDNLAGGWDESEEDAWTLFDMDFDMDDDLFWRIVHCWLAIFLLILITFQMYFGYKLMCVQLPKIKQRECKMMKLIDKKMLEVKKYKHKLARAVTINELKGAKAKDGEGKIQKY